MGRKRRREHNQHRPPQERSPKPDRQSSSREPSSFNKRFRQLSPTKFKVGGFVGLDRGCLIPALLFPGVAAPVVMLLFRLVFGQGSLMSWGGDPAVLAISLGCQLFPLIALMILLLARKFVFDKEAGELTAFNLLDKEQYPLAAVQSVEVDHRSHDVQDTHASKEFGPNRIVNGIGVGIILNTGESDFCLDMSFNCNLADSVEKAEQLAEFLEVPIVGAAYERFKSRSGE